MDIDQLTQQLREAEWLPIARQVAATDMRGLLTAEEVMAVWRLHPLWAPGGKYGPRLPSSPVDGILLRFRRLIDV